MADTMLAARAYEGEDEFRLDEVDRPEISADEVLVQVESSGLNRGLLSLWLHHTGFIQLMPSILGFEIAGVIAAAGPRAGFEVGERVLVHPGLSCRNCEYCRNGQDPDCPATANIGHALYSPAGMPLYERYHNGGLAEFARAPGWALERLPEQISFEVGARIPSVGVAHHSLSKLNLTPGSSVVINAASGAYGTAALAIADLFGIANVIAVARRRSGLESSAAVAKVPVTVVALEELGKGWESDGSLRAAVLEANSGEPVDGVLDLMPAGTAATIQATFAMRKGGTAVLTGGNADRLELPYLGLMQNSYVVRGARGSPRTTTRRLMRAVSAGRLELAHLISHRFALEDVNEARRVIWEREGSPWFVAVNPRMS